MTHAAKHMKPHRLLSNTVVLLLLGAWFYFLAPTAIGGPASYVVVSGHSMDGTYRTGDLIVTREQASYQVGDIVTFRVGDGGQVIHRIIDGNGHDGYVLQGDNNPDPDPWHPTDEDVVGRSWVRLAGAAWILDLPRNPIFAGSAAGILAILYLLLDERKQRHAGARSGGTDRRDADERSSEGALA